MSGSTWMRCKSTEIRPLAEAKEYLTAKEAARYLRLSVSNLAKRRLTGDTPEFFKVGRKVVYVRSALDRFMHSRTRRSTSDVGRGDD